MFSGNKQQNTLIPRLIDTTLNSGLPQKTKKDTVKVLNCLQYIKENLSIIQWAIDNPKERGIYRHRSDQKKKVLRDIDGTAFHIGRYQNGEEGVKALTSLINQIENILKNLPENRWLEFARRFDYDGDRGCLEARTQTPIQWAAGVLLNPTPDLNDIMAECYQEYNSSNKSLFAIAKAYCQKRQYTHCHLDGIEQKITDTVLRQYIKDVLMIEVDDSTTQADDQRVIAEKRLRSLERLIDEKSSWHAFSLFALTGKVLPRTAQTIKNKIEKCKTLQQTDADIWCKTAKEVNEILQKANTESSLFRHEDTVQFYKMAYNAYNSN